MAKARATVAQNDPSKVMAHVGLGITILLNAATGGYVYGGVSFRLAAVEERAAKLEKKVDDFGQFTADLAVVKTQLQAINTTLGELRSALAPVRSSGK